MKRILSLAVIAAAVMIATPSKAQASTLTCGTVQRTLAVYNVMGVCHFGNSANPDAALVGTTLGGSWTNEGTLTAANGTNDLLTVTADAWGPNANGTFTIDSSFWSTYGKGALSFHVGEGSGDPDWWIFEITTNFTGVGTFDLTRLSGGGGGLSNVNLWGSGTPDQQLTCTDNCEVAAVPEPASLVLFGTGLAGMATVIRRRTRKA